MDALHIRSATAEDAGTLLELIHALAEYEQLADQVVATEASLRAALAPEAAPVQALLAEIEGRAVGFALGFANFSTFLGSAGFYLEDLFVQPAWRGRGIGRALLARIAARAVARGAARVEWAVLDWNRPALDFYRRLGACALDEWRLHRLSGESLRELAASAAPSQGSEA
jgi:Acetyltransferases